MAKRVTFKLIDAPSNLLRVEAMPDDIDGSIVHYLDRNGNKDGARRILRFERPQDDPILELGNLSVAIRALRDRIEVVVTLKEVPGPPRAA